MSRAIAATAVALAAAASACVPSQRAMQAPVDRLLRERLGTDRPVPADVDALLAQPLTRASLTRIVLARHPRVAAALAELGVAAGEQGALRGVGRTEVELSARVAGDDPAIELAVMHEVLDLALAGPRRAAGDALAEAARARAAATVLAVTARAEQAFLDVAAADAQLAQARAGYDAIAASTELTGRVHAAGGTTDLALARAQAARESARVDVARAETALEAARTALDGAAGFTGAGTAWSLGEELPDLPAEPPALDGLEAEAIGASLELAALAADERGHANQARAGAIAAWLPELAIGVGVERTDAGTAVGPALRLGLPFLSGARGPAVADAARARSSALVADAVALELRAEARAVRVQALAAYAEARQLRDVVVPLQRRVLDETVLQYNAMNASPFELLSARHELATSEQALVEARHQLARALVAAAALRRGAPLDLPGANHASP